jgi:uncharacterized protein
VILPDVNILVQAFRSDSSGHKICRNWLDGVLNGDARCGMAPQVLGGVVRITTHPKVFAQPSRLDEVLRFCDILLDQPHCVVIQPGERHWKIFTHLCTEADAAAIWCPTHGLRRWPLSPAVNGSPSITTMRDSGIFDGVCQRDGV